MRFRKRQTKPRGFAFESFCFFLVEHDQHCHAPLAERKKRCEDYRTNSEADDDPSIRYWTDDAKFDREQAAQNCREYGKHREPQIAVMTGRFASLFEAKPDILIMFFVVHSFSFGDHRTSKTAAFSGGSFRSKYCFRDTMEQVDVRGSFSRYGRSFGTRASLRIETTCHCQAYRKKAYESESGTFDSHFEIKGSHSNLESLVPYGPR